MDSKVKNHVLLFLLLIGIVSLLSDLTYEGARSIYGPFLEVIGATAVVVSVTAGLGEFIGQALRIVTGYIADKTKQYWTMVFIGYSLNLLAIPLLAFVNPSIWQAAIALMLLERIGKGIRAPSKSALTSFASDQVGAGKAFAIQEVLDQFGAFLGPIIVFWILAIRNGDELLGYQTAFAFLGIFTIFTLTVLYIAKRKYPNPEAFEKPRAATNLTKDRAFLLYMVAVSFIAFGFIDYPVLAFHIKDVGLIPTAYIPLLYSLAMGIDAIAALIFGYLYDRYGVRSLQIGVFISLFTAPVFFLEQNAYTAVLAIALWGVGMGAQDSILKAVISTLVSKEKRGTAYGFFYSIFGFAWFLGSWAIGVAYEFSFLAVVAISMIAEIIALILLFFIPLRVKKT